LPGTEQIARKSNKKPATGFAVSREESPKSSLDRSFVVYFVYAGDF
jgi:hypothetical protein